MLKYRLMSGSILIAALILVVTFSRGWSNIFLPLMVSIISVISVNEFYSLLEPKGYKPLRKWANVFSVLYIFMIYFVSLKVFLQIEDLALIPMYLAIVTVALTVTFYQKIDTALNTLTSTLAGFFYVTWQLSFLMRIILWRGAEQMDGRYFCIFFIAVVKGTDIGAYFLGSYFGKHKLAPKISPKKTIEGSIGGAIFASTIGALLVAFLPSVSTYFQNAAGAIYPDGAYWLSIVLGALVALLLSTIGQLGDLAESIFKRDAKIKDSGGFIPGMGGALDVIDSLLFAAPLMYLIMKILEKF